jgi:hypothetical protein
MTPEDLDQIGAIVAAAEQRIIERQDRAVEAITANMSDLRAEIHTRFDKVDVRFDVLERRTERIETHMLAIMLQTAGMSKSLTEAEPTDSSFAASLSAQQRAIDDLAARVAKLERSSPSSH